MQIDLNELRATLRKDFAHMLGSALASLSSDPEYFKFADDFKFQYDVLHESAATYTLDGGNKKLVYTLTITDDDAPLRSGPVALRWSATALPSPEISIGVRSLFGDDDRLSLAEMILMDAERRIGAFSLN